jgi:hypothetical protein
LDTNVRLATAKRRKSGNVDFTSIFHARPKKISDSWLESAAFGRSSLPLVAVCARIKASSPFQFVITSMKILLWMGIARNFENDLRLRPHYYPFP